MVLVSRPLSFEKAENTCVVLYFQLQTHYIKPPPLVEITIKIQSNLQLRKTQQIN